MVGNCSAFSSAETLPSPDFFADYLPLKPELQPAHCGQESIHDRLQLEQ